MAVLQGIYLRPVHFERGGTERCGEGHSERLPNLLTRHTPIHGRFSECRLIP